MRPAMQPADFRAEFPVLERAAYLNAGTDGPVPRAGARAAADRLQEELVGGRSGRAFFDRRSALADDLRARIATLLAAPETAVALTRSTSDGVVTALSSYPLGQGDEVVTSDEEHPGLLVPLALASRHRGFSVREVPFAELVGASGPRTKLVACSHVSWVGGKVVDARALVRDGTAVLLDGAQALGAIPLDAVELGCDFYAGPGQKWLCGPDGTGSLYVRTGLAEQLDPPWPGYASLADMAQASQLVLHPSARRFDMGVSAGPATAWAVAALDVLARAGWQWVHHRAASLAARLADLLRERGIEVAPRGRSTLVSWRSADPDADVARLSKSAIVVRSIPGWGLVRASVGAWTSDEEIERLASVAVV